MRWSLVLAYTGTESLEGFPAGGDAPVPSASRTSRNKESMPEGEKKSAASPKPSGLPKSGSVNSTATAASASAGEKESRSAGKVSPGSSSRASPAAAAVATKPSPRPASEQVSQNGGCLDLVLWYSFAFPSPQKYVLFVGQVSP